MATSEQSGTSGPLTRPAGHFCYDDKVFNDPIHGHIRLHPLLVKIIDTPQFQRLRYIKQLGGCYFVYPGASHNRFEHSIGVAHLAGKLIESLQKEHQNDKELMDLMDKQTVLCVKIAGLCHDLGHGPFSHLWEKRFLKKQKKEKWEHEKASEKMLDHLIVQNDLTAEFEKYEIDIEFIKKLINPKEYTNSDNWPYDNKLKEKSFLFEIVANRRCAVDVDKWDYFKRDCHHLGMACSFDINRAMEFVRVIEVDGLRQICFREKELGNMYQMFHTRLSLHQAAYQHKTSNAVECMLSDALALADEHLTICGENKVLKMSECVDNMTVYTNLTDSVIHQILVSKSKDLQKSKELLMRIQKRDLYKFIGLINPSLNLEPNKVAKEIADYSNDLTEDCLEIDVVYFNFGMKEKNPVDQIRFYCKDDPNNAFPIQKSSHSIMFQQKFEEKIIRVYCKSADKVKEAESCYEKWTKRNPKQNQPDSHPLDGDAAILEPPEKRQKIQQ